MLVTREFVMTANFDKNWKNLDFGDDDLRELQNILLESPHAGDVIPGVSGARKVRVAANEHGKRGGARVIYVDVVSAERIYLLTAYPKNVKINLSEDEKKALTRLIRLLKTE